MKSLPADNIHQRLCDLRNGTGKSQKEVADELNIQASVLSRIERGETKSVSHDLVIKFAEYYNVSSDYLLCISDIRIRRNVELEELGLTNKALIQLLQGNVNGNILSRLLEHRHFPQLIDTVNSYFTEEHKAGFANRNAVIDMGTASLKELIKENPDCKMETQQGIREINAQKITGTEADIEKIKSIFLIIVKDIKKEFAIPLSDVSTEELKKQLDNMNTPTPFYGVWCEAYKNQSDALAATKKYINEGVDARVFVTTDWSNLNRQKWYVISAGVYSSKEEANAALSTIQSQYSDAYVKYSGSWQGEN